MRELLNARAYTCIERKALLSQEFRNLSATAKVFYFYLKCMYNGQNNGMITLPYVDMAGAVGCSDRGAVARAVHQLEANGWIEITHIKGFHRGANVYKLTFRHESAK